MYSLPQVIVMCEPLPSEGGGNLRMIVVMVVTSSDSCLPTSWETVHLPAPGRVAYGPACVWSSGVNAVYYYCCCGWSSSRYPWSFFFTVASRPFFGNAASGARGRLQVLMSYPVSYWPWCVRGNFGENSSGRTTPSSPFSQVRFGLGPSVFPAVR